MTILSNNFFFVSSRGQSGIVFRADLFAMENLETNMFLLTTITGKIKYLQLFVMNILREF